MVDQKFARLAAETIHDVGRWIRAIALDIDHASRVLHRIQYDRPWDSLACCGEGSGRSGPANGG